MTDYPALFQQGIDTNEALANIINQLITAAKERAVASGITYDNATSGLLATEVKSAIDELVISLALKAPITDPTFIGSPKGPDPTDPTGLANKQWVESVLPDISGKTGYPDYSNQIELPITQGLVQQITSDGYLNCYCPSGAVINMVSCESNGIEIGKMVDIKSGPYGTYHSTIFPIKKDDNFKLLTATGNPTITFISMR